MSLVLTLLLASATPDVGCAAMQRCVDLLTAKLCASYGEGLPAAATREERAIRRIERLMDEAKCIPASRPVLRCDFSVPDPDTYPPETCAGLVEPDR